MVFDQIRDPEIPITFRPQKRLNTLKYNHHNRFRLSCIHSPHLHIGVPGNFSDLLKSVQMLKRECGAKSNGKPQHLIIPGKTATFVSWVWGGRPAFGRTAAYVPVLALKDLPLGRSLWWWWFITQKHELLFIYSVSLSCRGRWAVVMPAWPLAHRSPDMRQS